MRLLTVVLVLGVVGGIVVGYSAASVRGDALTPLPTPTVLVPTPTPDLTPTVQTTLPNCAWPEVQPNQLCVIGEPRFPRCKVILPIAKLNTPCLKD